MITATRIACAALLILITPFSPLFWVVYVYGGLSDVADGLIARMLKQQSNFGAQLDSVADAAFLFAILFAVGPAIVAPSWIWICAIVILSLRLTTYAIGYKKYRAFSALHTYANKATGGLLFCAPILYAVWGATFMCVMLCLFAALSSFEELLIMVRSKILDRDRRSIFSR